MPSEDPPGQMSLLMLNLLPGETVIAHADRGPPLLTSNRVWYYSKAFGESHTVGIMLEDLTCCDFARTSKPWLLALAAFSVPMRYWLTDQRAALSLPALAAFFGFPCVAHYF